MSNHKDRVSAVLEQLETLQTTGKAICDAYRQFSEILGRWRAEASLRSRDASLLGAPTVTYHDLAQAHNEAARCYKNGLSVITSAEVELNGLADAIGNRLDNSEAFETHLRGTLRQAKENLQFTYGVVLLPTESLAKLIIRCTK